MSAMSTDLEFVVEAGAMKTTTLIFVLLVAACGTGPTAKPTSPHARRFGDDAPAGSTPWLPTQPTGPACLPGQDTCANPDRSAGGCCDTTVGNYCIGAQGACQGGCCP